MSEELDRRPLAMADRDQVIAREKGRLAAAVHRLVVAKAADRAIHAEGDRLMAVGQSGEAPGEYEAKMRKAADRVARARARLGRLLRAARLWGCVVNGRLYLDIDQFEYDEGALQGVVQMYHVADLDAPPRGR